MSLAEDYDLLFSTLQKIANEDPEHRPQLLAAILAGAPFRQALDKPEVMNKVIVLAKQIVADRHKDAVVQRSSQPNKSAPLAKSTTLRQLMPERGKAKA